MLKYQLVHKIASNTGVTCHFFIQTYTPPTPAQAQAAADSAHSAWSTNFASMLQVLDSLETVKVTDLSSSTGPVGINATLVAGARAGGTNPASTCVLQNLTVARRYRGGKPRIYWPYGVNTDLSTAQAWTAGFITQMGTAWNGFISAVIGGLQSWATQARFVTVSYYEGGEWKPDQNGNYHRVPTPRATPLVDAVVGGPFNVVPSTQRRRNRPG